MNASNASSGGGHDGGGDAAANKAAASARRQHNNDMAAEYFAAAMCGLIAIFTLLHWTRLLFSRSHRIPTGLSKPFVVVSRRLRNLLVRGAPGFNSAGHVLLVAVYVGINLAILLTNVDKTAINYVAARFGWMLVANLCFVVFLALKNTPLAFMTAYSYERLNCLHQIAGYTTFCLVVIHGAIYAYFDLKRGHAYTLRAPRQIAGIVAGFLLLLTTVSAILFRRHAYELFYVVHLLSFFGMAIGISLHRPVIVKHLPIVIMVTAGLFLADRLIRFVRLVTNCTSNKATVYPLPHGGTRILLAKQPSRAVPGKHVFLWVPHIRLFEMHPFTIIDTEANCGATEFVVKSYDGFTRKLHAYAAANPGAQLWAAAEGSYGTFPDPMEYDKIILIAGGSGASYTFGLAVNMLERMTAESAKNIVFIWTAKTEEYISWYSEHLNTLRTHEHSPKVDVSLFVTRAPGSSSSGEDTPNAGAAAAAAAARHAGEHGADSESHHDIEKDLVIVEKEGGRTAEKGDGQIEKAVAAAAAAQQVRARASDANVSESQQPLRHSYSSGRPDAATVIQQAVSSTAPSQRVLVAACGPPALMTTVRDATAKCIRSDGPAVELHCEQFGW